MRLKAIIVLIVALMMVTLGLASCGERRARKSRKIGLTAPLSGVSAQYGRI